jgi:hypothetical protein
LTLMGLSTLTGRKSCQPIDLLLALPFLSALPPPNLFKRFGKVFFYQTSHNVTHFAALLCGLKAHSGANLFIDRQNHALFTCIHN